VVAAPAKLSAPMTISFAAVVVAVAVDVAAVDVAVFVFVWSTTGFVRPVCSCAANAHRAETLVFQATLIVRPVPPVVTFAYQTDSVVVEPSRDSTLL
jgi:hypothetical protein